MITSSVILADGVNSIQPLVFGIEFGYGDVDDLHVPHGSMPATWLDHYGGQGFDGYTFAIEFDVAFSFENQVDLRHFLVIVRLGIFLNFNKVKRGDSVVFIHKSPASESAWARGGFDIGEVGDLVAFAHFEFNFWMVRLFRHSSGQQCN